MHAIHITNDNTLSWQPHCPAPLHAGQVRIRIAATAVNRADLVQRQGLYPPPAGYSDIPGLECAGELLEVAEGVQGLSVGMPVCALLSAGGYATEVVCDAGQVIPIPEGLSLEQAAALPEAFATAWYNLYMLARLQPAERVLIKAGGSGVGTAAIQLCKAFDNPVFVQVGSEEKLRRCRELGAQGGINRHQQSLMDLKPQSPFDVVLDPVAGEPLNDTLNLMNTNARLVIIGVMGGAKAQINVARLLVKRLSILGSTLRSQPVAIKAQIMRDLHQRIWPGFAHGRFQPIIEAVFPITEAEQAHALMSSDKTFGKIVLTVNQHNG